MYISILNLQVNTPKQVVLVIISQQHLRIQLLKMILTVVFLVMLLMVYGKALKT
nr:MAG TPA: hypothetical protein [Bacteriophage sp.]